MTTQSMISLLMFTGSEFVLQLMLVVFITTCVFNMANYNSFYQLVENWVSPMAHIDKETKSFRFKWCLDLTVTGNLRSDFECKKHSNFAAYFIMTSYIYSDINIVQDEGDWYHTENTPALIKYSGGWQKCKTTVNKMKNKLLMGTILFLKQSEPTIWL